MHRATTPKIIANARRLRSNMTIFERRLWRRLRLFKAYGFHFRRQVPFGAFILDFVEHSARVAIELDGDQHGQQANMRRDAERDAFLSHQGYRVIRFWNHELIEDFDGVVDLIYRTVHDQLSPTRSASASLRDAPPDRPPHKGEVG